MLLVRLASITEPLREHARFQVRSLRRISPSQILGKVRTPSCWRSCHFGWTAEVARRGPWSSDDASALRGHVPPVVSHRCDGRDGTASRHQRAVIVSTAQDFGWAARQLWHVCRSGLRDQRHSTLNAAISQDMPCEPANGSERTITCPIRKRQPKQNPPTQKPPAEMNMQPSVTGFGHLPWCGFRPLNAGPECVCV